MSYVLIIILQQFRSISMEMRAAIQRESTNIQDSNGNLYPRISINKQLLSLAGQIENNKLLKTDIIQSLQGNLNTEQPLQDLQQEMQSIKTEPQKKRINQFLFSYFIGLVIPMVNCSLMTSMMIQLKDKYVQQKSWTCIGLSIFMFVYFVSEGLVKFGLMKMLKYYFYPDRLLPGIIISSFAYLAMTQETANKFLYNKIAQITFSFWFFVMAGNLRVCLKEYNWSRWQIFLAKLAYLYSGTTVFYAGTCYIYWGVHSKFPAFIRDHIKDLVLLFIFGTVEALYQHYKFISSFDGTDQLKPPIDFQSSQKIQIKKQRTSKQLTGLMKKVKKIGI